MPVVLFMSLLAKGHSETQWLARHLLHFQCGGGLLPSAKAWRGEGEMVGAGAGEGGSGFIHTFCPLNLTQCLSLYISVELLIMELILSSSLSPSPLPQGVVTGTTNTTTTTTNTAPNTTTTTILFSGLSLRAKFNSGQTQKTLFSRCFGLTTLQIRGIIFFNGKFFFLKMMNKAIKFPTKHNEVISTICHGVRLALLIPKQFLF